MPGIVILLDLANSDEYTGPGSPERAADDRLAALAAATTGPPRRPTPSTNQRDVSAASAASARSRRSVRAGGETGRYDLINTYRRPGQAVRGDRRAGRDRPRGPHRLGVRPAVPERRGQDLSYPIGLATHASSPWASPLTEDLGLTEV